MGGFVMWFCPGHWQFAMDSHFQNIHFQDLSSAHLIHRKNSTPKQDLLQSDLAFDRLAIFFSAFESKTVNIAVTRLARTVEVCFLTPAIAYELFAVKSCPKICKYNYKFWLREAASVCQGLAMTLFDYKDAVSKRAQDRGARVGMAEVSWAGSEQGKRSMVGS